MASHNTSVLIIEDEDDIANLIEFNLRQEGYEVSRASTGEKGILALEQGPLPDLVVLDLMLPGMDGLEICKRLRSNESTQNLPVIMVTAKGEERDVVKGLEIGADDYVTKPFSPKVLIARVAAVLRRAEDAINEEEVGSPTDVIRIRDLVVHPGRHEVTQSGKPIKLTHSEFEIIRFLSSRPGWVFTRAQIVDAIRGENYAVTDRSIDVQIVGLRKKLSSKQEYIETVRGVGYRFKE